MYDATITCDALGSRDDEGGDDDSGECERGLEERNDAFAEEGEVTSYRRCMISITNLRA
jgi:hypothetical protein